MVEQSSGARRGIRRSAPRTIMLLAAAVVSMLPIRAGADTVENPRTVTVTPATNLGSQAVTVHWKHFLPSLPGAPHDVVILQCKAAVTDIVGDCYTALPPPHPDRGNLRIAATNGTGGGTATIEVRGTATLPQLGCGVATPCSILVIENGLFSAERLANKAAVAPISFAPTAADCPAAGIPDVSLEGASASARAVYAWIGRQCTGETPLSGNYLELSSPAGRRDFLDDLVDVAVTGTPFTAEELAAAPGHRVFAYAPVDANAVVVAFNIKDNQGQPIPELNLTPRLVARIIADSANLRTGNLFTDPEFLAVNPGHTWPLNRLAPPLLRSESNADTYLLTSWLAADTDARRFLAGEEPGMPVDPAWQGIAYPTDTFELRKDSVEYVPRRGTRLVVENLLYGEARRNPPPGPGDQATTAAVSPLQEGLVGVTDLATARAFGLPVARLRNAAGTFVAPEPAGLAAAYAAMTTNPDGVTRAPNFAAPDAAAYPIPRIDYAVLPTSATSTDKAARIRRFVEYATGPGQASGVLPYGYSALPEAFQAQTADALAAMSAGAVAPVGPASVDDGAAPADTDADATATGGSGGAGSAAPPAAPAVLAAAVEGAAPASSGPAGANGPPGGRPGTSLRGAVPASSTAPGAGPAAPAPSRSPAESVRRALAVVGRSAARMVLPALVGIGLLAGVSGPVVLWRGRRRPGQGPRTT
ncbi:MAG TPA: substrate-binding domain-containing protein [Acidimicrobiales bacterium]|nr:substrate-binding domain-containing protein [Acidimicrobiales bacterium]